LTIIYLNLEFLCTIHFWRSTDPSVGSDDRRVGPLIIMLRLGATQKPLPGDDMPIENLSDAATPSLNALMPPDSE
jgi:hypothetical protein